MIGIPLPANTSSNAAGELAVTVTDEDLELAGPVVRVHQQVAGLLSGPGIRSDWR